MIPDISLLYVMFVIGAISIAVNYCINPNVKGFFLPRYTFTKVPDFLGTSLISRLPDSLDHGKQKSLLLRLFDHGFIGVITITPQQVPSLT